MACQTRQNYSSPRTSFTRKIFPHTPHATFASDSGIKYFGLAFWPETLAWITGPRFQGPERKTIDDN